MPKDSRKQKGQPGPDNEFVLILFFSLTLIGGGIGMKIDWPTAMIFSGSSLLGVSLFQKILDAWIVAVRIRSLKK
jgi:hypothetical protein